MNTVAIVMLLGQIGLEWSIFIWDIVPQFTSGRRFLVVLCVLWPITGLFLLGFYVSASFGDPGYLKRTWLREAQQLPNFREELDDNGEKSFCLSCQMPRPLRAHHCAICQRCVVLMDHHCDFTGNCIGHRNYKNFYAFLVFMIAHSALNIWFIVYAFFLPTRTFRRAVIRIGGGCYFAGFGFWCARQLYKQTKFLLRNSNWIEGSANPVRDKLYREAKRKWVGRYDIGIRGNLAQRLGKNPLLWFLPVPNTHPGYVFPKNPEHIPIWELPFVAQPDDDSVDLLPAARISPLSRRDISP
jgi:palmitoyltransferase